MSKSKVVVEFNLPEEFYDYQVYTKSESMHTALKGIRDLLSDLDKKHRKLDKCFIQQLKEYIADSGVYFL